MAKSQSCVVKYSIDDLIAAVYAAFDEIPHFKINHCFLTLMHLMSEVIITGGGNNYSLPHMHKHALAKAKALPERMSLTDNALKCLDIGPAGISFHNAVVMVVQENGMESDGDAE